MDLELNTEKQVSAAHYSKLAFIFGVISLAGLICCFPVMPIFGGLGIIFALISRGGAGVFSPDAKRGLTFSIIGTASSLILGIAVFAGSMWLTLSELKKDPGMVDELRETYEQMYDNMGMEVPDELYEMLDRMEEYSRELNDQ